MGHLVGGTWLWWSWEVVQREGKLQLNHKAWFGWGLGGVWVGGPGTQEGAVRFQQ